MKTAENGNTVSVHYKGTFPDGEVFDDSRLRGEAMNVLIGAGNIISGFETALLGMTEGETKTVNLKAEEAYGQPDPNAIATVPKPENYDFEIGAKVQGQDPTGNVVLAEIVSFDAENVTLDHNHPLVGRELNFEIELVKIDASEDTTGE